MGRRAVGAPIVVAAVLAAASAALSGNAYGSAGPAERAGAAAAAGLAPLFTNAGIGDDANPGAADLDGGGFSFSAEQLDAVGWAPGLSFALSDGATVPVPAIGPGRADNALASGQTFALAGTGRTLDFVVTSTDGDTSGT